MLVLVSPSAPVLDPWNLSLLGNRIVLEAVFLSFPPYHPLSTAVCVILVIFTVPRIIESLGLLRRATLPPPPPALAGRACRMVEMSRGTLVVRLPSSNCHSVLPPCPPSPSAGRACPARFAAIARTRRGMHGSTPEPRREVPRHGGRPPPPRLGAAAGRGRRRLALVVRAEQARGVHHRRRQDVRDRHGRRLRGVVSNAVSLACPSVVPRVFFDAWRHPVSCGGNTFVSRLSPSGLHGTNSLPARCVRSITSMYRRSEGSRKERGGGTDNNAASAGRRRRRGNWATSANVRPAIHPSPQVRSCVTCFQAGGDR